MDYSARHEARQPYSGRPYLGRPHPAAPPRQRHAKLAAALGVERRGLDAVLEGVRNDLHGLRALGLADLTALTNRRDAERIFYLVQWERLQVFLGAHGELPERTELEPLLKALTPIFERHFSRGERLNETLLALYRAALSGRGESTYLTPRPPSPARRLLTWLGFSRGF